MVVPPESPPFRAGRFNFVAIESFWGLVVLISLTKVPGRGHLPLLSRYSQVKVFDPVTSLQDRYARGELSLAEFTLRVEHILQHYEHTFR